MRLQPVLTWVLLLLGAGFLVANALRIVEYLRFVRRWRAALLTWQAARPPYYWMAIAIGVVLGCLIVVKIRLGRQVGGETMMFVYYACLTPLNAQISRGFYEDGIWADTDFIPYDEVGGISWREGEQRATLVINSRLRNRAYRLVVPGDKYEAARRLLRDKIREHAIRFGGSGLDLGEHDQREDV